MSDLHGATSGASTIWLGDSHSRFNLGRPDLEGRLTRASESDFVWSIGPRLMHSVAQRGWPADVRLGGWLVRPAGRRADVTLCCVLGEIDVRVYLGRNVEDGSLDLSFVPGYVSRCAGLARTMGARPVIVVPVPPHGPADPAHDFPRKGSLEARVLAHRALAQALADAAERISMPVFDATTQLALPSGELRPELTDDGIHLDPAGAESFARAWAQFRGGEDG